jgi:hypothetical protein
MMREDTVNDATTGFAMSATAQNVDTVKSALNKSTKKVKQGFQSLQEAQRMVESINKQPSTRKLLHGSIEIIWFMLSFKDNCNTQQQEGEG